MDKNNDINKILLDMSSKGITFNDLLKYSVDEDIEAFNSLIAWSEKDYEEYSILLERAKSTKSTKTNGVNTKDVGDVLEDLVKFIIDRTYFFESIGNIRTKTNEIDLYISMSKEGLQAMEKYNISRELLVIPENEFVSECKNYGQNIGSTWYGKFYAVMKTCDCNFGILFSLKKATGNFDKWSDSYGLIRTLRLIEKYENKKEFYLIDFGIADFESINKDTSFFDIIERKMIALKTGTDYDNFVNKLNKDLEKEQRDFLEQFKHNKEER